MDPIRLTSATFDRLTREARNTSPHPVELLDFGRELVIGPLTFRLDEYPRRRHGDDESEWGA